MSAARTVEPRPRGWSRYGRPAGVRNQSQPGGKSTSGDVRQQRASGAAATASGSPPTAPRAGLAVRIAQCIFALTTGILLNTVNGQPARALRAYGGRWITSSLQEFALQNRLGCKPSARPRFRDDAIVFRLYAEGQARSRLEPALRRNAAVRRWSLEAAHNPEVAGSNPAPATREGPGNRGLLRL
jgi:hypothetical protein